MSIPRPTRAEIAAKADRIVSACGVARDAGTRKKLCEVVEALQYVNAALAKALEAVAPEVCGYLCPSVKYTDDPWTHVDKCRAITAALAEYAKRKQEGKK